MVKENPMARLKGAFGGAAGGCTVACWGAATGGAVGPCHTKTNKHQHEWRKRNKSNEAAAYRWMIGLRSGKRCAIAIHSFCCRNRPCEHDTVHGCRHNSRNIDTNNTRHKRTEYGHEQQAGCLRQPWMPSQPQPSTTRVESATRTAKRTSTTYAKQPRDQG